jgi:hypothetical protein
MNKFILVLLLALVSCGGFRLGLGDGEVPVDDIYAAVVALFRGLAETDEATCAGVLENQKDKILEIVYAAIDEVKAGEDVSTAAQNALLKLMGVDGLVSECNVLAMPAIITKVTSKEGLVDIFQALIDNIDDVYSFGEDIKAAFDEKDYNAAAEAFGHILAIALDFQVNL